MIRRGWDWVGLTPTTPELVCGLIEAPGLASALTLNKGDFIRAGRRGITYLAYRKAIQEVVQAQLTAWGEARDRGDKARRRAARPVERDLETVLVDLAEEFPALSALVERRAGGQRRLPTGAVEPPAGSLAGAATRGAPEPAREAEGPGDGAGEDPALTEAKVAAASTPETAVGDHDAETAGAAVTLPPVGRASGGPRRPGRYGLTINFEERAESTEMGRLVESTVIVNTAHPAYRRAVASRSEGYHTALSVGLALAAVAVEPSRAQAFLTAFLARWGEALGRDRRRRKGRPSARPGKRTPGRA